MRAAAILGLSDVTKIKVQFQRLTGAEWMPALNDAEVAVIFGGDGTVHRHLAELVERKIPLLVVPCGSGNDFARALAIRNLRDAAEAWRRYESDRSALRTIDLGVICETSNSKSSHYFCCVAGVGIDCSISAKANRLPPWLRAHGGYALCASREFIRYAPATMTIGLNGNAGAAAPTILAAVANAPAYGGGMRIAPRAKLDDGKLDLCLVRAMSAFKLFCLFPSVYFGRHLGFREVEYLQTDTVRIQTDLPLDVYADGEYICKTPVDFRVARGVLKVLAPSTLTP